MILMGDWQLGVWVNEIIMGMKQHTYNEWWSS